MQRKHLGVLAALAALGAAAPHGAQQNALFSPAHTSSVNSFVNTQGPCWKICAPLEIECPEGMETGGSHGCWTCCVRDPEVAKSTVKSIESASTTCSGVMAPFPFMLDCQAGEHVEPVGPIFMCCKDSSDAKAGSLLQSSNSNKGICWLVILPEEPKCPEGWEAQQTGDYWTCCLKQPDHTAKSVSKSPGTGICLRVCWPEEPTCPEGWQAEQEGGCWTCCLKPATSVGLSDTETCIPWTLPFPCPGTSVPHGDGTEDCCVATVAKGFVRATRQRLVQLYKARPEAAVVKSTTGSKDDCLGLCFMNPAAGSPACHALSPFTNPMFDPERKCFDCCMAGPFFQPVPKADSKSLSRVDSHSIVDLFQEVCWLVCFPDKPECPAPSTAKQFGQCWTCCFDINPDHEATMIKTLGAVSEIHSTSLQSAPREACLMICVDENVKCSGNTYKKQFGDCWTCCADLGGDLQTLPQTAAQDLAAVALFEGYHASKKEAPVVTEVYPICLRVCFAPGQECPEDLYADPASTKDCKICCLKERSDAVAEL